VLTYALLYFKNNKVLPNYAGIISFKNMSDGFMPVTFAGELSTETKQITTDVLETFQSHLCNLVLEICNAQVPFLEKEIK